MKTTISVLSILFTFNLFAQDQAVDSVGCVVKDNGQRRIINAKVNGPADSFKLNGEELSFGITQEENSSYIIFDLADLTKKSVNIVTMPIELNKGVENRMVYSSFYSDVNLSIDCYANLKLESLNKE